MIKVPLGFHPLQHFVIDNTCYSDHFVYIFMCRYIYSRETIPPPLKSMDSQFPKRQLTIVWTRKLVNYTLLGYQLGLHLLTLKVKYVYMFSECCRHKQNELEVSEEPKFKILRSRWRLIDKLRYIFLIPELTSRGDCWRLCKRFENIFLKCY